MNITRALGIIDPQRGFMPTAEGNRLHVDGFGELPVTDGEQIVKPVNRLLGAYAVAGEEIFTTQDWHPHQTAHFSNTPDFVTDWPRHCVDGTAGAELHPEIIVPPTRDRFIKGFDALEDGAEDTSYSGYYAEDPTTGDTLPTWLRKRGVKEVVLGGLALDYCVGKTALDLRQKLGLEVIVALDATRGISDEAVADMLRQFESTGVRTATTDEVLATLPQVA